VFPAAVSVGESVDELIQQHGHVPRGGVVLWQVVDGARVSFERFLRETVHLGQVAKHVQSRLAVAQSPAQIQLSILLRITFLFLLLTSHNSLPQKNNYDKKPFPKQGYVQFLIRLFKPICQL